MYKVMAQDVPQGGVSNMLLIGQYTSDEAVLEACRPGKYLGYRITDLETGAVYDRSSFKNHRNEVRGKLGQALLR